ncbi:oxidoreductase subunit of the alternative pyrimidine degradation pathway [Sterolibacterium denitrificans]|uniref:Putative NADH dehydrogenase/NAD(P)H nitroreductase SDENCHOL_11219 n=1 Tax=Sterolibacterium denitrificans TaxID=157592 RepID=A0A7Z7HR72_9PROT|nr:malonic semialdehyde reductase [Sterolibacterium denitrificans]SMB25162.1 oxidoreductase subunit of the alternative pyrimidine degradation pathway [Sterolibacterium denitrificans]
MPAPLDTASLAQLFTNARTHNGFAAEEVSDATLRQLYDLLKWGPTAANNCPARFVFVKSQEAKARLKPALAAGNVEKTMAAPVTVIVARDMTFYEHLPTLYPATDARSWFVGNDAMIEETSLRDSTLQGAYLILAARALGLDCGPMGGFDKTTLDAAFFAGTPLKSVFLINLGHGDPGKLYPRGPRLDFDTVCRIA